MRNGPTNQCRYVRKPLQRGHIETDGSVSRRRVSQDATRCVETPECLEPRGGILGAAYVGTRKRVLPHRCLNAPDFMSAQNLPFPDGKRSGFGRLLGASAIWVATVGVRGQGFALGAQFSKFVSKTDPSRRLRLREILVENRPSGAKSRRQPDLSVVTGLTPKSRSQAPF